MEGSFESNVPPARGRGPIETRQLIRVILIQVDDIRLKGETVLHHGRCLPGCRPQRRPYLSRVAIQRAHVIGAEVLFVDDASGLQR